MYKNIDKSNPQNYIQKVVYTYNSVEQCGSTAESKMAICQYWPSQVNNLANSKVGREFMGSADC